MGHRWTRIHADRFICMHRRESAALIPCLSSPRRCIVAMTGVSATEIGKWATDGHGFTRIVLSVCIGVHLWASFALPYLASSMRVCVDMNVRKCVMEKGPRMDTDSRGSFYLCASACICGLNSLIRFEQPGRRNHARHGEISVPISPWIEAS